MTGSKSWRSSSRLRRSTGMAVAASGAPYRRARVDQERAWRAGAPVGGLHTARLIVVSVVAVNLAAAQFDELQQLRRHNAAWKLLRADNAPFVLGILGRIFDEENVRAISEAGLLQRLDDEPRRSRRTVVRMVEFHQNWCPRTELNHNPTVMHRADLPR